MKPRPETHAAVHLATVLSAILIALDQVVELRALAVGNGNGRTMTMAGFFDGAHRPQMAEAALRLTNNAHGVYFTLNPVNPDLLARRCNRVARAEAGDLTKDKDIIARRWLLIDVDPMRASGISATDAEKAEALAIAYAVREFLRARGWPDPVLADSGNGYHLLYRIDLPADDGGLVQRILIAIAAHFDTDHVKIDRAVYNPARLCKLPLTWARKGDHTDDRPHRQARLIEVPPVGLVGDLTDDVVNQWVVQPVPVELLNDIAADDPPGTCISQTPPAPPPTQGGQIGQSARRLIVAKWLADRGVGFRQKPEPDGKDRTVFTLDVCPFDPAHGADAAIFQARDGKLGAHCFHNGCADNGWQQFKEKIGKPDPDHFDPPGNSRVGARLPVPTAGSGQSRRPVEITTEEGVVNDCVVEELAKEEGIFQRNGELVRVLMVMPEDDRPWLSAAPRIEAVPPAALRDLISRWVEFYKTVQRRGEEVIELKHPPAWSVNAVSSRGVWGGIRHLAGVVSFPVLRPDGSVLTGRGYDPVTGLFLHWPSGRLRIPRAPTRADAVKAVAELFDIVSDFPFQSEIHKSAWLSGLLTPLARPAFEGPAPLFLVDANVRAAGKGLLLEVISRIVTGNPFPVISYPAGSQDGEEELRKKITTLLMYGDRMALFDNLTGGFGNGTLDRCLTSTDWQDRQLGFNRQFRGRMDVTFYATGNNVAVLADTARRVCHIRLESPHERPEERADLKRPNLIRWVIDNRDRLLSAALTILRAYHLAGRPDHGLKPWGSFESWSQLVRNAVVWCGLPDPGETRQVVQEQADETGRGLRLLLTALEKIDPRREGLTTADILARAYDEDARDPTEVREALVAAIESLVRKPDSRKLGYQLRHLRKRVVDGRFLDLGGQTGGVNRWVVRPSEEFNVGPVKCPSSPPCASTAEPDRKDMEEIEDMFATESSEEDERARRARLYKVQRLPD